MSTQSRQPAGSILGLRGGLGRTLLIAFLLLTIIPLGVNASLVVSRTNQEMHQATQERLQGIVTLKTAQIDGWLAHQEEALAQVSAELAARPATATVFQTEPGAPSAAAAEVRTLLAATLAQQTGFQAFRLARSADDGETPLLMVTASRPTTSTLSASRVVPIPGPRGEPMGVLVGYLDPDPLVSLVAQVSDLGPSGRAYLVTPGGQPLWLASAPPGPFHSPGIDAGLSRTRGSALYQDYQGQAVVGAYDWIPALGLAIVVEQSQKEAFASAEDLAALLLANTLVVALVTTLLAALIIRRITRPIVTLTMRAVQIAGGDLSQTVPVQRRDEIGILGQAFNVMTTELRHLYDNLESIVAERTRQIREANRQLQYYTMRLSLSAEIGRVATSILDPDALLKQVTTLIRDSYELSYAGVFLLDETRRQVILRSSSSPGMWGWSIPCQTLVGDETPIGQAAGDGKPHLAHWTPSHVELAIPLRSSQQVLGVLDLWSEDFDAFSESDVRVLQGLGDQVSIAIENAQAYTQEQETGRKLRQLETLRVQSLSSMSHELATALNSIIGFSRLLLRGVDGPLTDLQRRDLAAIHQSGYYLLTMLDYVVDLASLERGTLTLDRRPLDVEALIGEVLAATTGQMAALRGTISPHLPPVQGDRKRLRQVLIHLIAQAGETAETVVLSADVSGGQGQQEVRIRITGLADSATPVPADLTPPTEEVAWDEGGASLGLTLSKQIVELHGGHLRAQPMTDGGQVYVVLLPVEE